MTTRFVVVALFVGLLCAADVRAGAQGAAGRPVLIVTDVPAPMEALAEGLRATASLTVDVVSPDALPAFSAYRAIVAAVESPIGPDVSQTLQTYAADGGTLVVLGRSIGPAQPAAWLAFLGVRVPDTGGPADRARELSGIPVELVALTHRSPVIEDRIAYDRAVLYASAGRPREMRLPGLAMPPTRVLVNLGHTRLKRPLLGFKVSDPDTGAIVMQDTAAWVEERERGALYYFMVGTGASDFSVPSYVRMIANAVTP